MAEEKRDFERFAGDIATIKSILMAADERFFYEPWFFYIMGAFVLVGACAQYFLSLNGYTLSTIFFNMWIPLLIFHNFIEGYAWIKKVKKEGLPYFPRYAIKLWTAITGACIGISLFLIIIVKHTGAMYLPAVVLAILSIFMFFIAQVSYPFYYFYAVLLGAAAFALYLMELDLTIRFLISEALMGLIMIAMGKSTSMKEKGNGI